MPSVHTEHPCGHWDPRRSLQPPGCPAAGPFSPSLSQTTSPGGSWGHRGVQVGGDGEVAAPAGARQRKPPRNSFFLSRLLPSFQLHNNINCKCLIPCGLKHRNKATSSLPVLVACWWQRHAKKPRGRDALEPRQQGGKVRGLNTGQRSKIPSLSGFLLLHWTHGQHTSAQPASVGQGYIIPVSTGVPFSCPPFCILFPLRMGSSYKGSCEIPVPVT